MWRFLDLEVISKINPINATVTETMMMISVADIIKKMPIFWIGIGKVNKFCP